MANEPSEPIPAPRSYESIQCLRGIAACLVVLLHTGVFLRKQAGDWTLPAWTHSGGIGVDLFFCISGFIMYWTQRDAFGRKGAPAGFLVRRVLRIYPAYWIATALTCLVAAWVPAVAGDPGRSAGYVVKSLLLLPQSGSPLLGQGWTLVHEMRFYAVFAAGLFLPRTWALRGMAVWAALSAAVLATSALRPEWLTRSWGLPAAFLAHPSSLEFIAGVGAAWLVARKPPSPAVAWTAFAAGAASLLLAMAVFAGADDRWLAYKYLSLVLFMAPSALFTLGTALVERARPTRFPRFLVLLGDASYSIYLVHLLVIVPAVGRIVQDRLPSPPVVGWGWTLAVAAVAAGLAFHAGVERPLHRRSRDWAARLERMGGSGARPGNGATPR